MFWRETKENKRIKKRKTRKNISKKTVKKYRDVHDKKSICDMTSFIYTCVIQTVWLRG